MTGHDSTITYVPDYRHPSWDPSVPSRPGWTVTCPTCGQMGRPRGWAYATRGIAASVRTKHRTARARKDTR